MGKRIVHLYVSTNATEHVMKYRSLKYIDSIAAQLDQNSGGVMHRRFIVALLF